MKNPSISSAAQAPKYSPQYAQRNEIWSIRDFVSGSFLLYLLAPSAQMHAATCWAAWSSNSASAYGMRIDTVNVMAMDYGSSADNGGQMGLDAENAASATHSQTGKNIGITPMIGVNGGCVGAGYASPTCSSISQSNYQFASIFESF